MAGGPRPAMPGRPPGSAKVPDIATHRLADPPGGRLGLMDVPEVVPTGPVLSEVLEDGDGLLRPAAGHVARQRRHRRRHVGAEHFDRTERTASSSPRLVPPPPRPPE